jgi:hypothetical protein
MYPRNWPRGLKSLPADERPLRADRPRPKTVPFVAAFLFAATVIASIVGVSLLFPSRLLETMWKLNPEGAVLFHSIGALSGVLLLVLGGGTFAAARGLLHGRRWAWWFSVALFAIDVCGNIVSCFVTHDVLRPLTGALVSLIFLCALCGSSVRRYFLRQELTPNHKT